MTSRSRQGHRLDKIGSASMRIWDSKEAQHRGEPFARNASVDCGWGTLIFAHTFVENADLVRATLDEASNTRNIALYLRDPHVVLSLAPQDLFLDPSHTYRLWLANYLPARIKASGFRLRRLQHRTDAQHVHRLLTSRGMVAPDPDFIWNQRKNRVIEFFVAEEAESNRLLGAVMGIDHVEAFEDPENGASMWCLAVDANAHQPGVGRALVAYAADCFSARGRAFMDLSVMHDNRAVIDLYEKMGFVRIPAFCIKRRNAINRDLYTSDQSLAELNPYAKIIVEEATRRGIAVDVIDAANGYFTLQFGGRRVVCRESLSELTSAIAMSRCDDKSVTHSVLRDAGVAVPKQQIAQDALVDEAFMEECGTVVVKPAQGEQGRGVHLNITEPTELREAVERVAEMGSKVILEEQVSGQDLRVVVIDYRVVAAAIRRPAEITGTGTHSIAALIEKQSRRRAAATGGESRIPMDQETERCLDAQGLALTDVLPEGKCVPVRRTANLHTGGTLHDVTAELSEALRRESEKIAELLSIPVVGLDFVVDAPDGEKYTLIEANERPGLANHEPQPTAERFVDFIFPQTAATAAQHQSAAR